MKCVALLIRIHFWFLREIQKDKETLMKVPPKEVIEAAGELVKWYGPRFKYLGEIEDQDVFMFCFPADDMHHFIS